MFCRWQPAWLCVALGRQSTSPSSTISCPTEPKLTLLAVTDEYTRECLTNEAARSFTVQDMVGSLQYLFIVGDTPRHLRSDKGPDNVAKTVRRG